MPRAAQVTLDDFNAYRFIYGRRQQLIHNVGQSRLYVANTSTWSRSGISRTVTAFMTKTPRSLQGFHCHRVGQEEFADRYCAAKTRLSSLESLTKLGLHLFGIGQFKLSPLLQHLKEQIDFLLHIHVTLLCSFFICLP